MANPYIHHEISFTEAGATDSNSGALSIVLDSDFNGGKTSFSTNDLVHFLIAHSASYVAKSSDGVFSRVGTGIQKEVTDKITFAYSKTGTLSNVPVSIISWSWGGSSKGSPVFSGKKITLSNEVVGVLSVTYRVNNDRWSLISAIAADIVVAAFQESDNLKASATVTINDSATLVGPWVLNTKNFCNDNVIPGSSVYVDTLFKGLTDVNGKVALGMLTQGEHIVSITSPGYLSTDADHLNNDKFTITV